VHKVTIIPRGQALGVTQTLPTEDRLNMYKSAALDFIAMAMGGRIAEELVFGEMSSGAANDIERATAYARAMVCEWGMSEKLGPLAFGQAEGEVFLGRQLGSRTKDYSEATAIEIDEEVRRIVSEQYNKAKTILAERREILENMAEALIEYETLDTEDVNVIMNNGKIIREKPAPRVAPPPRTERKEKEREKKNILEALESLGKPPPEPSKA
jgi:cell division protease FtsH